MNKPIFALLLIMCLGHATVTYTADVDRRGYAAVTVSVENGEGVSVPLPDDAHGLVVVGGSYSVSDGIAHLVPGSTGFSSLSYSSEVLTQKFGIGWKLLLSPPENASVKVYMPPHSSVGISTPEPGAVAAEDSRTMLEFAPSDSVVVEYVLHDFATVDNEGNPFSIMLLLGGAMVLGAIMRDLYSRLDKKPMVGAERKPTLEMTAGKEEMMETFNENDKVVVGMLLENQGKAKRNALERKTGVSKSSLSVSLNRLEKRKIIEMDRTSTTHFVKLSDYFMKL